MGDETVYLVTITNIRLATSPQNKMNQEIYPIRALCVRSSVVAEFKQVIGQYNRSQLALQKQDRC